MPRIRFKQRAEENRVRQVEQPDGKLKDENYKIVYQPGQEIECSDSTANRWKMRGVAEIVSNKPHVPAPRLAQNTGTPSATQAPSPAYGILPPPPSDS